MRIPNRLSSPPTRRPPACLGFLGVTALLTGACHRAPPGSPVGAPPGPGLPSAEVSLAVEWAGCAGVRSGPTCLLGARRAVTVWTDSPSALAWVPMTDRGAVSPRNGTGVDAGTRWSVDVPPDVARLELRSPDGRTVWSLAIAEIGVHPEVDRWLTLGRTGKYAEALAGLERFRATGPAREQGPTQAAIGRMALALGRFEQAEPALRAALSAAEAEGRISDVVRDGAALLWGLVWLQQRFGDARALLHEMSPYGAQYPEGRVWLDFHAGLLAASTGDIRAALQRYRAAEQRGRRLDLGELTSSASNEIASQLILLGRVDEALVLIRRLPIPEEPCARASRALDLAWALIEQETRQTALGATVSDPEVATAVAAMEKSVEACPDPHRRLLSAINAAEYGLSTGADATVARALGAIQDDSSDHDVFLGSWRADVLGRWRLRRRELAGALVAFDDEVRSARGAGLMEETFRGEVGAGRALLGLGRRRAAVTRLRGAQGLLDTMLREVPMGEGRGSFLGGHEEAVRYLVGALVDGGAPADALRVARWTRSAELAQASKVDRLAHLPVSAQRRWDDAIGTYQRIRKEIEHEAENDWTVARADLSRLRERRRLRAEQARGALDQAYRWLVADGGDVGARSLSNPAAGEVYLGFFPGPTGWFVLAARAGSVVARPFAESELGSPAGAARVLATVDSELGTARRLRLFPYGASDRIDWQAIGWRGRPLIASLEIEYGLDVAAARAPGPGPRRQGGEAPDLREALVVADPNGDLPSAVAEVNAVERTLATTWKVVRLEGAAATRDAVLVGLSRARIVHYAGHAEVDPSVELSSALVLSGQARIQLGDLLALPSVPELAVLSACEAARTADQHPSLMGLGQAFVAAGARAVIAPTRPIADAFARAFARGFYGALQSESGVEVESVHRAFHSAVLGVLGVQEGGAQRGPEAEDWKSLRLLVP
jgi:tetratricopeptide (TPR) repeat protein